MSAGNLRPWARWLIQHKLRWVLTVLAVCSAPAYLLYYLPDAYEDFKRDLATLRRLK